MKVSGLSFDQGGWFDVYIVGDSTLIYNTQRNIFTIGLWAHGCRSERP